LNNNNIDKTLFLRERDEVLADGPNKIAGFEVDELVRMYQGGGETYMTYKDDDMQNDDISDEIVDDTATYSLDEGVESGCFSLLPVSLKF